MDLLAPIAALVATGAVKSRMGKLEFLERRKAMAKRGKCDKCRIKWNIRIKDQTPLRELECPQCAGQVTPIYSPCNYHLADGEPNLNPGKF